MRFVRFVAGGEQRSKSTLQAEKKEKGSAPPFSDGE
jgi:hypothetical protein